MREKTNTNNFSAENLREAVHHGVHPGRQTLRERLAPQVRELLEAGKIEEISSLLKSHGATSTLKSRRKRNSVFKLFEPFDLFLLVLVVMNLSVFVCSVS